MMVTFMWIVIGMALGFALGFNHTEGATFVANYRRMEAENKELLTKVAKQKEIIKELVDSNRSLVKELEGKSKND